MTHKGILSISIVFLSICSFGQKKPAAKPANGAITKETANKMVEYSNSVLSLMQDKLNADQFVTSYNTLSTSIREEWSRINAFHFINDYKNMAALVKAFEEVNKTNPTIPPNFVPKADAAYLTSNFANYNACGERIILLYKSMEPLIYFKDEGNKKEGQLKQKNNYEALSNIADKIYFTIDTLFLIRDHIIDKSDDIGAKGEAVILASHPLKAEIMDMKKTLRLCKKIAKTINQPTDLAGLNATFPTTDSLITALSAMAKKYEAYKGNPKSDNIQKGHIKGFFERVTTDYIKRYDELKSDCESNKKTWNEISHTQQYMYKEYEGMISNYNSFADENNY